MAILLSDNFKYQGRNPLDSRLLVETTTDMKGIPPYSLYEGMLVYVKNEHKYYTYDSTNSIDPLLEKWRELSLGGSSSSIEEYVQDRKYKSNSILWVKDDKNIEHYVRVLKDFTSDISKSSVFESFEFDRDNENILEFSYPKKYAIVSTKNVNIQWDSLTTILDSDIVRFCDPEHIDIIYILDNASCICGIGYLNKYDSVTKEYTIMCHELGALLKPYIQGNSYKENELVFLDSKVARVKNDFTADSLAATIHESWKLDLKKNLDIINPDQAIVVDEYKRNTEYEKNMLVYREEKLARVIDGYISDNSTGLTDDQSFFKDITDNKLALISGNEFKIHTLTTDSLEEKINASKVILTPATFTDVQLGHLVYDQEGRVGKIVAIDTIAQTLTIVTVSNNGGKIVRYLANIELDDSILKQSSINLSDLDGTYSVNEIKENQLIYDKKGTIAKIDSIDINTNEIKITTITTVGKYFELEFYEYKNSLKKDINQVQTFPISDLNTVVGISDFLENQIVYDSEGTLAKIETIDKTNSEITVRIVSSSASASVREYKISDVLNITIDAQQVIKAPAGINIKAIKTEQLVYDDNGTLAKIINIDETNNELTVQTITGLGMPTAPDTKKSVVIDGGHGYAQGDVIETEDPGYFVEITNVDSNGVILEVVDTTSNATPTNGVDAKITREQEIYGGFGNNWAKLSDAAVKVATTIAEKFEYLEGYAFEIQDAGSGYQVNQTVATQNANVFVTITSVDVNGEILSVEYSRNTVDDSTGQNAIINVTPNKNMFIIDDKHWNEGITIFSLTNDEGAWVEFIRTDSSLVKYSSGPDGKTYRFVYNPNNGTITQSYYECGGGSTSGVSYEPTKSYLENDLIMQNNKLYKCTQDYIATNDFDTDLNNGYWEQYNIFEIGGEII